jgi:FkbM family methyltransferase
MVKRVSLPNQVDVWAPSALEAAIVYREVVTEATYCSHGIVLDDAPVVFDVGANIGLFSMHLAAMRPRAQVHAFEPIPVLYEILRRNLAEHAPGAVAYNVGVADRRCEATFEFNPFMTISSTMHPEVFAASRTTAPASAWMAAGVRDLDSAAPSRVSRMLAAGLAHRATRPVVTAALLPLAGLLALRGRLFLQRPRCQLDTLSALIAATGVPRIDLAKVDVEGAEEQVIAGVADADWPRIRQLVVEVHDLDGRLERLTRRLEGVGFTVTHAREDWATHDMLRIWTLYARRDDA